MGKHWEDKARAGTKKHRHLIGGKMMGGNPSPQITEARIECKLSISREMD